MGNPARSARRLHRAVRRTDRGDDAVTEIVGTLLLLAVAVGLAGAFVVFLFTAPPPSPQSHLDVSTFILPSAPTTVVLEHRGGQTLALEDLQVTLTLDGTATSVDVGDRLAAGDPKWSVVGADGVAKTSTGRFQPGDQVRYTDASVQGASVQVFIADSSQRSEVLAALAVQATDAAAPVFASAATTSTTTVEVTFSEPLLDVDATDFTVTVPARTISAARLIGNGSIVEITVTSAWTADATPSVNTIASPAGTHDLANNLVTGGISVTAADGTAPTVTLVSSGTPTSSATTVTWTTDETANTTVYFGVGPHLGRVATDASGTAHSVGLSQLTELTLYFFTVASTDAAGNTATTVGTPFITADDGGGGGGGGGSGTPSLALTPAAASTAGTASAAWTVTYRDAAGAPAVPPSAVTVYLATNSTAGEFRDATTSAKIQTVTISGSSSTTFKYYDERAGIPTILAAAVGVVGDARSTTVDDAGVAAWRAQPVGRQVAGTEFSVVLEAVDAYGNLDNEYATATSFKFSGASVAGGNLPKAGVLTADTAFGSTTGAFTFSAGRTVAKMTLFANETADVAFSDTTSGSSNAKAPLRVAVASGATLELAFSPHRPVATKGLWAGPFFVVAQDAYGNNVTQLAGLTVTVGGTGVTYATTPGGSTTTTLTIPAGSPRVGFFLKSDTASTGVALSATSTGATAGAATLYVNDLATGGSGGAPNYLEFSSVPTSVDAGIQTPAITVMLKDAAGATVATSGAVTLASNSTYGQFWNSAGTARVTSVTLASGVATFRYRDERLDGGPSVLTAYMTNTIPASGVVRVDGHGLLPAGSGASSVWVRTMYPGAQARNVDTTIGASILNPTGTAMTVDSVTFSVSPSLGSGTSAFFRSLSSQGAGSSSGWTCSTGAGTLTGSNQDSITCNPAAGVTVPAYGMTQVVIPFTTSNRNSAANTIIATSVALTSPAGTATAPTIPVRHAASGSNFAVYPLSGTGGDVRAGFPGAAAGVSNDFYILWDFKSGNTALNTLIEIPPGWTDVSVPSQTALSTVSASVRQPTLTSPGEINILQVTSSGTTREFVFSAKPPAGETVNTFALYMEDNQGTFVAFYRVGVSVS